jgi:hypothetical protein
MANKVDFKMNGIRVYLRKGIEPEDDVDLDWYGISHPFNDVEGNKHFWIDTTKATEETITDYMKSNGVGDLEIQCAIMSLKMMK